MAISQLNTVFAKHHRIIFGVFSVLIIIAFMDFLTPGTGLLDAFRGNGYNQTAGEIFGKKVSYSELNDQIRLDMLSMQVFMNMPVNQSMREQLENQSFFNLAHLAAARKANIHVSDGEVARFLRNNFRGEDGKFNMTAYRNFVDNYLASEGFNENDLNEAARQYLMMAKFQDSLNASIVTTPGEIELFYNMVNEEFNVLAGEFAAADFAKQVKVDKKALDGYFQANRNKYMIPAKIQALVVAFPYSQYRSQAIKLVKDPELKAFYEQNKQLFSQVKDGKVVVQEFNKVKNQVRSSAIAAKARELAGNAAQQFAGSAYEAIGNVPAEKRLTVFKQQLAAAKLVAKPTGEFNADSKSAGNINEAALVSELAGVFTDIPLSNAVAGKDAAYIGYVTKLTPARNAEFKEVARQVTADFVKAESYKAAVARANEVVAKLNAMPIDTRVARVKAMKKPQFKAIKGFTLMTGSPELGYAAAAVSDLQPGAVAEPVRKIDSVQVLVMASRKAPAKAFKADPMLENMFYSYKRSMAQMQYNSYIASHCKRYAQPAAAQAAAE